jgi:hypothetical protein
MMHCPQDQPNVVSVPTGENLAEFLLPLSLDNHLLSVSRLPEHDNEHFRELKDPSIAQLSDGSFLMYASVGNSVTQKWIVGRFVAPSASGPWTEVAPVEFVNLSGAELCAPAVMYDNKDGKDLFTMYIQTTCFSENGIIAFAESDDGRVFQGRSAVASKETLAHTVHPVVGVYDAGVSEVVIDEEVYLCMIFSAYRKVGCGDIYMTTKKKYDPDAVWSEAICIIEQENVPFHNMPSDQHFEWGLEGGKILQIFNEMFLFAGVCFLPKPHAQGTRQRVFFAASTSVKGPYIPLGTPFHPTESGEHGHPDVFVKDRSLEIVYQERHGEGMPWHLRFAKYDLEKLHGVLKESVYSAQLGA